MEDEPWPLHSSPQSEYPSASTTGETSSPSLCSVLFAPILKLFLFFTDLNDGLSSQTPCANPQAVCSSVSQN